MHTYRFDLFISEEYIGAFYLDADSEEEAREKWGQALALDTDWDCRDWTGKQCKLPTHPADEIVEEEAGDPSEPGHPDNPRSNYD